MQALPLLALPLACRGGGLSVFDTIVAKSFSDIVGGPRSGSAAICDPDLCVHLHGLVKHTISCSQTRFAKMQPTSRCLDQTCLPLPARPLVLAGEPARLARLVLVCRDDRKLLHWIRIRG